MFKMKGQDGREYGPVSADVLRQWIGERRADGRTLVQAEGTEGYRPLAEWPEFQAALAEAATVPRPPGGAGMPGGAPGAKASADLARASLVCGVLSLCLPILGSLAAIVTGHMALARIRRDPVRYTGRGLATAGLVIGYLGLLFVPAFFAGLTLPALSKAKSKSQRIQCVSHLKQIALGARIYANDNREVFPPTFGAMSNELVSPKILVCPGDAGRVPAADWNEYRESVQVSYQYLRPGAKESEVMAETVFVCPIHNNVALGDGSVQMVPPGGRR